MVSSHTIIQSFNQWISRTCISNLQTKSQQQSRDLCNDINKEVQNIDREFEFYDFFSFLKFNEFYEFFFGWKKLQKIRNFANRMFNLFWCSGM